MWQYVWEEKHCSVENKKLIIHNIKGQKLFCIKATVTEFSVFSFFEEIEETKFKKNKNNLNQKKLKTNCLFLFMLKTENQVTLAL